MAEIKNSPDCAFCRVRSRTEKWRSKAKEMVHRFLGGFFGD